MLILAALIANLVMMLGRPGETLAQPAGDRKVVQNGSTTIVVPENATITVAPAAVKDVKILPAKNDRGAVVRVEVSGVTIEAAKMRFRYKDQDHEFTAGDGKSFNVK